MESRTNDSATAFGIIGTLGVLGIGATLLMAKSRNSKIKEESESLEVLNSASNGYTNYRSVITTPLSAYVEVGAYYYTVKYGYSNNDQRNETAYSLDKKRLINDMNRLMQKLYKRYPKYTKNTDGYGNTVSYTFTNSRQIPIAVVTVSIPNWGMSTKVPMATDEVKRVQGIDAFEYKKRDC